MTHLHYGQVEVGQFMLMCAARRELARPAASALIPIFLKGQVELICQHERDVLIRSIDGDLRDDAQPHVTAAWESLYAALKTAHSGPRHPTTIPVTARFVVAATHYALGRRTYMRSMVADELVRVAPNILIRDRAEIIRAIVDHPSGSTEESEDGRSWAAAVAALRTAPEATFELPPRPPVG